MGLLPGGRVLVKQARKMNYDINFTIKAGAGQITFPIYRVPVSGGVEPLEPSEIENLMVSIDNQVLEASQSGVNVTAAYSDVAEGKHVVAISGSLNNASFYLLYGVRAEELGVPAEVTAPNAYVSLEPTGEGTIEQQLQALRERMTAAEGDIDDLETAVLGITTNYATKEEVQETLGEILAAIQALPDGQAVSAQVALNTAAISDLQKGKVDVALSKNLFDIAAATIGRYLDANGDDHGSANYSFSDYIPVLPGEPYHISAFGDFEAGSSSVYSCWYDENKSFISSFNLQTQVTAPATAKYLRVSIRNTAGGVMVEHGTYRSEYEPYSPIGAHNIVPHGQCVRAGNMIGNISRLRPCSAVSATSIVSGSGIEDSSFPHTLKKNRRIFASIKGVSAFSSVFVGWGQDNNYGYSVKIDATNVYVIKGARTSTPELVGAHGLTISEFLDVQIIGSEYGVPTLIVTTMSGSYVCTLPNSVSYSRGKSYFYSDGTSASSLSLVSSSSDLSKDIWFFGDSYMTISPSRWPSVFFDAKITDYAIFAYPGASSENQCDDLVRALQFGVPKYIVWTLGMNNADADAAPNTAWLDRLNRVIAIAEQYDATLILATVPCVPNASYENFYKNEVVRASGYRYIDFAKVVNAESQGATWYAGMLSNDNVHPTELGAKVLANAVMQDFQEIFNSGKVEYSAE